jgi:hypothetical protein
MTLSTVTIKYIGILVIKNPSSGIWSCPFSIIVSKNGCDVIWSIRQWRHWTSIWESEKRPHIWELDADLRIGRRLEIERRSESYIYIKVVMYISIDCNCVFNHDVFEAEYIIYKKNCFTNKVTSWNMVK